MIPIYLCEDEAGIRAYLVGEIQRVVMVENLDMALACQTADPKKLLDACRGADASGIYFLDVDLGIEGFNGFDLAREIRRLDPRGAIVFVTSHEELSMETFRYKLEAMDYILKEDMDGLSARLQECLESACRRMAENSRDQSQYYAVKVFDTLHHIPLRRILYFETSPHKHRIILHAEDEVLEFFGSLQTIEAQVGAGFLRCHRSFLVNRDKIRAIHLREDAVELVDGRWCPLSRKAKKGLAGEV